MNNPPAFPNIQPAKWNDIGDHTYDSGMTLRDYFAAAAMQAIVGNSDAVAQSETQENPRDLIASGAYRIADAMLKAREQ